MTKAPYQRTVLSPAALYCSLPLPPLALALLLSETRPKRQAAALSHAPLKVSSLQVVEKEPGCSWALVFQVLAAALHP
jgi:hypothetical protein